MKTVKSTNNKLVITENGQPQGAAPTGCGIINRYVGIHYHWYLPIIDITVSIYGFVMGELSLLSAADVQQSLCLWLKGQRRALKLSRGALAERSMVPASTIKKFETTGQISLRQLLLLWQCVADLQPLYSLTQASAAEAAPASIDEVLRRGL